jgi:hypothetical protein
MPPILIVSGFTALRRHRAPGELPLVLVRFGEALGEGGAERGAHAGVDRAVDPGPARQGALHRAVQALAELFGVMDDQAAVGRRQQVEQGLVPDGGKRQRQALVGRQQAELAGRQRELELGARRIPVQGGWALIVVHDK